jgi:hypothetical protein
MIDELERTWKETAVAYLKLLCWNLPEKTEEEKFSQVASLWPGNPWRTFHVAGPTARCVPDTPSMKNFSHIASQTTEYVLNADPWKTQIMWPFPWPDTSQMQIYGNLKLRIVSPSSSFTLECYNLNSGYYVSPYYNQTSIVLYTCRNHVNFQSMNLT